MLQSSRKLKMFYEWNSRITVFKKIYVIKKGTKITVFIVRELDIRRVADCTHIHIKKRTMHNMRYSSLINNETFT
jgi:hypothetical protein